MWMQKGSQVKIATPGVNKRINVFITMLYPSRALIWDTFQRRRSEEYQKHEKHLLDFMEHHGIQKLIQVQDNAKSHNSKSTQRFHAEHPRIVPFFLPSYSPQLNDEEAQNRRLKHYLCCNQSYDSVTDLEKKARKFLWKHNLNHKFVALNNVA
jgi:transposase